MTTGVNLINRKDASPSIRSIKTVVLKLPAVSILQIQAASNINISIGRSRKQDELAAFRRAFASFLAQVANDSATTHKVRVKYSVKLGDADSTFFRVTAPLASLQLLKLRVPCTRKIK